MPRIRTLLIPTAALVAVLVALPGCGGGGGEGEFGQEFEKPADFGKNVPADSDGTEQPFKRDKS